MKAITYRVLWGGEMRELEGFPTGVPGLVVGRRPQTPGFAIVHLRSGTLIANNFDAPEAALAAAKLLAPLAEWTRTGEEMQEYPQDPEFVIALHSAVDRFGGHIPTHGAPNGARAVDNGVIA
jgi:hypothetical protein